MVFTVLVVLYNNELVNPRKENSIRLTQVTLVINGITNSKDTKDEVKQRSDRSVFTVNVTSLITSKRTNRLGNFGSSLRKFLLF